MIRDPPSSRAIVIGTSRNNCNDPKLPPIPQVERSVASLVHLLHGPAFGLAAGHVDMLLNVPVKDVVDALRRRCAEPLDALLVYYAGHAQIVEPDGEPEALRISFPETVWEKGETSLPFVRLWNAALRSQTPLRIFIADCCYGSHPLSGLRHQTFGGRDQGLQGACYVAASPANAAALADPNEARTMFTERLVSVLDSGLPNGKATLGVKETFEVVRTRCEASGLRDVAVMSYLTGEDVPFAHNRAYDADRAADDALRDIGEFASRWMRKLRDPTDVRLPTPFIRDARRLLGPAYSHLNRLVVHAELGEDILQREGSAEDGVAALDTLADALRRYEALAGPTAHRRRRAARNATSSLRTFDDDNGLLLERRAEVLLALRELAAEARRNR